MVDVNRRSPEKIGSYKKCTLHNRSRQYCKDCFYLLNYGRPPSLRTPVRGICIHGNKYIYCKEPECRNVLPHHLGRGSLCVAHGVRRDLCRRCRGSGLCEHGRQRPHCRECQGSNFCPKHPGTRKHLCIPCKGSSICKHGRQRYFCKECPGAGVCHHGRRKNQCSDCRKNSQEASKADAARELQLTQENLTSLRASRSLATRNSSTAEFSQHFIEAKHHTRLVVPPTAPILIIMLMTLAPLLLFVMRPVRIKTRKFKV